LDRGEGRCVVSMFEFGGKCFQGTVFDDVARDGFMRKFAQIPVSHRALKLQNKESSDGERQLGCALTATISGLNT